MNNDKLWKISKNDFIVAGICLFAFLIIPLFFFTRKAVSNDERKALIYIDNKLVKEANLQDKNILEVEKLQLEVNNGKIRILNSDCPKKVCKHMGWISDPGQIIICVPNKVFIEIAGVSDDTQYDIVSY